MRGMEEPLGGCPFREIVSAWISHCGWRTVSSCVLWCVLNRENGVGS